MTRGKYQLISLKQRLEKWFIKDDRIEVVSGYNFLGLCFDNRLNWSIIFDTIALQAGLDSYFEKCKFPTSFSL